MSSPAVNLVVMQPPGYAHSLAFVDVARYLRWQFARLGADASISKNRLREDAVNLVFGAHLGFPPEWRQRHACIFVNLEQLGAGGAAVSPEYLSLLRGSAVVDYDAANVAAYAQDPADVPLVSFLHAPYLDDGTAPPIEARPIDLLFFGSMNARREAFVRRVEASGVQVSFLDRALYGPERDAIVRQSKAVLNCHFYETGRFEQVRAFHCLSLGTPVISERTPHTRAPEGFRDAVFWLDDATLDRFFRDIFRSPRFGEAARSRLAAFRAQDPIEGYADLLAFVIGFGQVEAARLQGVPWRPAALHDGPAHEYRPGWLNVGTDPAAEPDATLDLGAPLALPTVLATRGGSPVLLEPGSLERAVVLVDRGDALAARVGAALALLAEGGELEIRVGVGRDLAVRDDPVWRDATERPWAIGGLEHRFELTGSVFLDDALQPCEPERACWLRATMTKVPTTAGERTFARTMRQDFGGLPDDLAALAPVGGTSDEAADAPGPAADPAPATPFAPLPAAVRVAPGADRVPAPPRPPSAPAAEPAGLPRFLERIAR